MSPYRLSSLPLLLLLAAAVVVLVLPSNADLLRVWETGDGISLACADYKTGAETGLAMLLLPAQRVLHNPVTDFIAERVLRQAPASALARTHASSDVQQMTAWSGVVTLAIGMGWTVAGIYGYDQWVLASIPIKLAVAAVGLGVALFAPEKMSPILFVACVNDALCSVTIAHAMGGNWLGRKPTSRWRRQEKAD